MISAANILKILNVLCLKEYGIKCAKFYTYSTSAGVIFIKPLVSKILHGNRLNVLKSIVLCE